MEYKVRQGAQGCTPTRRFTARGAELFAPVPARFIEETASLISVVFLVHLFLNGFFLP